MNDKLKPCPFCGEQGILKEYPYALSNDSVYRVECESCNASVGSYNTTPEKAIARWNTRAECTCEAVEMDAAGNPPYNQSDWIYNDNTTGCSECGYPFGRSSRINYCPYCGAKVIKS